MKLSTVASLATSATFVSSSPLQARNPTAEREPGLYFFVFGDSYSTIGFNISDRQPSVAYPLGNPPSAGVLDEGSALNTAAGENWVEFLTNTFNTTTTLTYDFAISGASITDAFREQVLLEYEPRYASPQYYNNAPSNGNFGRWHDAALDAADSVFPGRGWNGNNSIHASWIGINDINWDSLLFSGNGSDFYATFPARFQLYGNLMDGVYNTGARNFFFINIPPLNRAPMIRQQNETIQQNYEQGVRIWNEEFLPRFVNNFTKTHEGARSIIYDSHAIFTEILDHPHAYGFKDNISYNCTGCMWWNNYHPVSAVHYRLANDMVANLTTIGWAVY